jgi:hypothetical protein
MRGQRQEELFKSFKVFLTVQLLTHNGQVRRLREGPLTRFLVHVSHPAMATERRALLLFRDVCDEGFGGSD